MGIMTNGLQDPVLVPKSSHAQVAGAADPACSHWAREGVSPRNAYRRLQARGTLFAVSAV